MEVKESDYENEDTEKTGDGDESTNSVHEKLVGALRPALFLENLYGIFRFRLSNNELVPADAKMKIVGVIVPLTYLLLFFNLLDIPDLITGKSQLIDVVNEVPCVGILLQHVVTAIRMTLFHDERNITLVKTMADLDCKLHINTNQEFYKKSYTITKRFVFFLVCIHTLSGVINLVTDIDIDKSVIVDFAIYMQQSLEILLFCLMVLALRRRLNVLNNYLAKFISEKDDDNKSSIFIVSEKKVGSEGFNLIGRSSADNTKIRDLAVTYDMIGEICELVSEIFNFQIFMALVASFTFVVMTIWSSLYFYKKGGENKVTLVDTIIWCFMNIFIVAFMSFICEKLLREREDTKIYVNKIIMDYDLPKTMRVQAKAFMELVEAWPLRIFVYDMFSVDITLMLKYISVATTYLIVIIQISHFT